MKKNLLMIVLLALTMCSNACAASTKITDMTNDASPTSDDIIPTVNNPTITPGNRKVTLGNLQTFILSGSVSAATALASNPADCSAGNYATTIAANGDLTCAQVAFSQISGSVTDAQVPNSITIDNATTATALASNPTDCSANQFATTIAASGNLTCAQPAFTDLSGSATDAQIPDTITASNYLPLAGGTMTGALNLGSYTMTSDGTATVATLGGTTADTKEVTLAVQDSTVDTTLTIQADVAGTLVPLDTTAATNGYCVKMVVAAGKVNFVSSGAACQSPTTYLSSLGSSTDYGLVVWNGTAGTTVRDGGALGAYIDSAGIVYANGFVSNGVGVNSITNLNVSGKIGIGKTNPTSALDVVGTINSTQDIYAQNMGLSGTGGNIDVAQTGGGTGGGIINASLNKGSALTVGNRLGLFSWKGSTDASGTMYRGANIFATATETWSGTAGGTKLSFGVTPNTTQTITTAMTIQQNAKIGIGNTAPTVALDVTGTIRATVGYRSADGTQGVTVTTCTGFKNGLCISGS